jgi:hypothetical protein
MPDRYSWTFLPVVETIAGAKIETKGGMNVIKNMNSAVCQRAKP